jgi:geranylgeranyl diphosphate synthase type I
MAGYEALTKEIMEIGERSRERHREIFLRNVDHPEVQEALENVLSYWRYNLRAALMQFSYEAVGGSGHSTDLLAEFFSIAGAGVGIHDDIIDRTYRKRGRITVPGTFGPDFALTIGDMLIVKGLMSISDVLREMEKEKVIRILEAYESFFTEMCIGEVMEIRARKSLEMSLDEYDDMMWKLGVDSEFCMRAGAIIGGGTDEEIEFLSEFGRTFGYLCRLHDEIDDMVNLEAKLGYRIQFEAIPLPILYAAKKSEENNKIISEILSESLSFEHLAQLFGVCLNCGSFEYIKKLSEQNMKKSLDLLNGIQGGSDKLELICWNLNQEIQKKI